MENAIIIRSENQFKSKALNTATAGLAKAFKNIESGRKDACAILAKIERNQSYKEDGFKSLAEYAETIGINKSLAHKMENAGRMLISEDETIKAFANNTDFSKLAILSSANEKDIKKAIEDGSLTSESTQAEVKEIKANMKTEGKDKVLSKFKVRGEIGNTDFEYDAIEIEIIPELEGLVKVGTFDFVTGENTSEKRTVFASPISGIMAWISTEKVKKEKAKIKSVKGNSFSIEELEAMLAKARAEAENK